MKRAFLTLAFCALVGVAPSLASADIFLAMADGSTSVGQDTATSGTINIYVSDDINIDTGAFFDVFTSNVGAVQLTGATVFNPEILVAGMPFDVRWQSTGNGDVINGGAQIDEVNGFRVNEGTGILTGQVTGQLSEDQGHDATLGAFLFGSVDYTVDFTGVTEDVTISLDTGFGFVVDNGIELNPNYGAFTFTAIPEPTSAALIALTAIGMVARRRR